MRSRRGDGLPRRPSPRVRQQQGRGEGDMRSKAASAVAVARLVGGRARIEAKIIPPLPPFGQKRSKTIGHLKANRQIAGAGRGRIIDADRDELIGARCEFGKRSRRLDPQQPRFPRRGQLAQDRRDLIVANAQRDGRPIAHEPPSSEGESECPKSPFALSASRGTGRMTGPPCASSSPTATSCLRPTRSGCNRRKPSSSASKEAGSSSSGSISTRTGSPAGAPRGAWTSTPTHANGSPARRSRGSTVIRAEITPPSGACVRARSCGGLSLAAGRGLLALGLRGRVLRFALRGRSLFLLARINIRTKLVPTDGALRRRLDR